MLTFSAIQSRIRQDHARSIAILDKHGVPMHLRESLDVALTVEEHRWAWRPAEVRLILVAESHVFTTQEEVSQEMDVAKLPVAARRAPLRFVRLVYCLGYGESELVPGVHSRNNRGTPQYWKLFGFLTASRPMPRRADRVQLADRLAWKVEVLQRLADKGIWLLDASLHAIYSPGAHRLDLTAKRELHRVWLEGYGRLVLEAHPGAEVWCIGKTVWDDLHKLGWKANDWIYQPQARVSNPVREEQLSCLVDRVSRLPRGAR